MGLGELVLQVAQQGLGVVAQQDRANALLALGHQDRAQRALAEGEVDGCPGAAGAVLPRAHAQALVGAFVETAVGVVAGVIDGIGDRALAIFQVRAQAPGTESGGVGLGGEAGFGLEQAMQVERADGQLGAELIEAGRGVAGFDQPAGAGDQLAVAGGAGAGGGGATFTGAVAGGFGGGWGVVELDVGSLGEARFAAGVAVDAGGAHGVDEVAGGGGFAGFYGLPALVGGGVGVHRSASR
ncbi:hypothetical protein D3C75_876420 [compost metagenome]